MPLMLFSGGVWLCIMLYFVRVGWMAKAYILLLMLLSLVLDAIGSRDDGVFLQYAGTFIHTSIACVFITIGRMPPVSQSSVTYAYSSQIIGRS